MSNISKSENNDKSIDDISIKDASIEANTSSSVKESVEDKETNISSDNSKESKDLDTPIENEPFSDSSSDSILQEQKRRETAIMQKKEPTIAVLPERSSKKRSFLLNGMKVTIRKRPTHKVTKQNI